jgi:hypothetical protein
MMMGKIRKEIKRLVLVPHLLIQSFSGVSKNAMIVEVFLGKS